MIRSAGGGGTFSHDETVLQVRLTTAQKLVVRHLKKHGFGPRIANRLVTLLYQHLMGLPLLGGAFVTKYHKAAVAARHPLCSKEGVC